MHELDKQLHEMKQAMIRRTHLLARMNTLLDQRDVLREKEQRPQSINPAMSSP